jgi:hypothetical protein
VRCVLAGVTSGLPTCGCVAPRPGAGEGVVVVGIEMLGTRVVGAVVAPPEGTYVVVPPLGGATAPPAAEGAVPEGDVLAPARGADLGAADVPRPVAGELVAALAASPGGASASTAAVTNAKTIDPEASAGARQLARHAADEACRRIGICGPC